MLSVRWLKMASLYFVVGSCIGMWMSISHLVQYAAGHAHVQLLGWVSMGIFAAVYKLFPALEKSKLAMWHFWMYQAFLPIMMIGLFVLLSGNLSLGEKIIPFGATPTVIAIILFGVNCWTSLKSDEVTTAVKKTA